MCSHRLPALVAVLSAAPLAGAMQQRSTLSITYRSPTVAVPSPTPITEGDVLTPALGGAPAYGPLAPPTIFLPGGPPGGVGLGLPLWAACVGHPPGFPCGVEVDALSFGTDFPVTPGPFAAGTFVFSVDEFAVSFPGAPLAPHVASESAVGDSASDVFEDLGLPGAPLPPPGAGAVPGCSGLYDGNGLPSASGAHYPGFGLIEPNFQAPPLPIDGDQLDAYDIDDGPMPGTQPYFSLDAGFLDPALGLPNTNSAILNGFLPGMILTVPAPGAPIAVYAIPQQLGLDLVGSAGSDDIDALAVWENGLPGFQVGGPFSWSTGGSDMVLFSVRRGSAVVGTPDALTGAPIQPGDILCPPPAQGMPPAIFIAAEWLGIATQRSHGVPFGGDDLDALDTRWIPATALPYCFGTVALCPCGLGGAPGNGCSNSIFAVGANLAATGRASVAGDTVVITGTKMPNSTVLYFQGNGQVAAVFGDGLRCAAVGVLRLATKVNAGNSSSYPNLGAGDPPISVRGAIPAAGGTRFYQGWYRNAAPFCTPATFNLTNGLAIFWTP